MWEFSQSPFDGLPIDKLKVDQAYLNITSTLNKNVWMYVLSSECVSCPFKKFRKVLANSNALEKIETSTKLSWAIFENKNSSKEAFCQISPENVGQFGVYNLTIDATGCTFRELREPANTTLSIFLVTILGLLLYAAFKGSKHLYVKFGKKSPENFVSTANNLTDETKQRSSTRLCSLDTFRGLAIVAMIFANSGTGRYSWLEHATWNGIHAADFIFPSFLWIMGVCIPISIKSQVLKNITKSKMVHNILVRSIKLFLIGFFIHTAHGPKLSEIRIMGVLQRFGIAYFVAATLYVFLGKPIRIEEHEDDQSKWKWKSLLYDIIVLTPQWLIMLSIVAFHIFIIFFYPVPNCPSGYLGPGGTHEMGHFNNCIGGATGYIDRFLLGEKHLYQHPRANSVYGGSVPFDPEGVFGCLLTIVQVFFGVQCGQILLSHTEWKQRLTRWCAWGSVTLAVGCILCKFSIEDGFIPINKNLWSLSYVLVTTAFAFFLLSIFYYVIDVKKWWTGKPLIFAGMNAIVMYAGSELLGKMYPFYWHIGAMNTHFMFLLANVWTTAMWIFVAYYLYLRKIFISL